MNTKNHIHLTLTREQTLSAYEYFLEEAERKATGLRYFGYMEIGDALDNLRHTTDFVRTIALALEENDEKEA